MYRSLAHTAFNAPDSERICIISTSGGMASLLADMADERDLLLPDIDEETEQTLLNMEDLLSFGEFHNPADIRGYGADVLPKIAESLFADDAFDAYVFAVGLPAVGERAEQIADDILTVREMAKDPVIFLWTGRKDPEPDDEVPLPYEKVRQETPLYYNPETCMDAVASLVRFGEYDAAGGAGAAGTSLGTPDLSANDSLAWSVPANSILTWSESEQFLAAAKIESPDTRLATSAEEARLHAEAIGGDVVLKVDSRDIPHRTDAGAVIVGVEPAEIDEHYSGLYANAHDYASDAEIKGILVQEQADLDMATEVLVGVSVVESFGRVVTVAPGGEFVELFNEGTGTTLIPPVSKQTAREAIESSKLGDLLNGYRGRPPSDVDALSTLVSRVSQLVIAANDPPINELDLNPVLVNPEGEGISVVDILVQTGSTE